MNAGLCLAWLLRTLETYSIDAAPPQNILCKKWVFCEAVLTGPTVSTVPSIPLRLEDNQPTFSSTARSLCHCYLTRLITIV